MNAVKELIRYLEQQDPESSIFIKTKEGNDTVYTRITATELYRGQGSVILISDPDRKIRFCGK